MKKVLFAAVAVLALASCKKDWSCECKGVSSTSTDFTMPLKDLSKKDADKACEAYEYSGINTCDLK
jgi:hypothetical protein